MVILYTDMALKVVLIIVTQSMVGLIVLLGMLGYKGKGF